MIWLLVVSGFPCLLYAALCISRHTLRHAVWVLRLWLPLLGWSAGMTLAGPAGNEKASGAAGVFLGLILLNLAVVAMAILVLAARSSTRQAGRQALGTLPLFLVMAVLAFAVSRTAFPEWRETGGRPSVSAVERASRGMSGRRRTERGAVGRSFRGTTSKGHSG